MVPYQGVAPRRGAATTTQRRLLVVDDDDSVRRLLVTVLGEDHEVHAFADAQALVAAVEAGLDADGAVVDVMMPGMDGFALTAWLRANPRTADIAIIVLTALGDAEHRERAREVGADAFVTKPFEPNLLNATVSMHLASAWSF